MTPHSSTLACKIPWTEEPDRLQSMGSRRVGHDWSNFTFTFHFHALEKEMATHSTVLAWRIPGTGEPGGLPSMGSHKVGHNWSDLAAVSVAEPQGKPKNTRVDNLSLLQRIFPIQESNQGLLHCRWILYQLSYQGSLCDPMDYTVHGILLVRILEWVAFSFSRGSSQPRDRTQVSCIAGRFFTSWATREAQYMVEPPIKLTELFWDLDISCLPILHTLLSHVEFILDFNWKFYASDIKINTLRVDIMKRDKLRV